jgi:hypothetical protein
MILLLEIVSMTLMRNIARIKDFMVKAVFSAAMFYAENSIEFAKIERPGPGAPPTPLSPPM